MSNKTYDTLKWIQRIVLPAIAVFVSTILGLLNNAEVTHLSGEMIALVVGCITATDTLLGAVLGVSQYNYDKALEVDSDGTDRAVSD